MTLDLHQLRVFACVVEQGGFSRAAKVLNLSQPAVSKSVQQLERQVGMALLERVGRTPTVTEAGGLLLARARELFAVERSAEEELRTLRGLEGGVLRVGASTTIATYLLSPYLARFAAAHSAVRLVVVSANTRSIARALVERRLDVALVEGPVTDSRISAKKWREDELVVIAPPGHALAARSRVTLGDLADELFIVRERGSGTRQVAEDALAQRGMRIRVALQLGSTAAITQSVAAGLGLAIVSRFAVADQVELGRISVVRLTGVKFSRSLTELRLVGRAPSAAAVAFVALLGERPTRSRDPGN